MMVKKLLLGSIIMFSFGLDAVGQAVEVSAYGGYQFGGKLYTREGDVTAANGGNYGAALDVLINESFIEFFWVRYESALTLQSFSEGPVELFKSPIEYFMIGGGQNFEVADGFFPFLMGGLGAMVVTPKDVDLSREALFAASLSGGFRYMFSDRIGIRAHLRLLLPFQWGSGGLWCGTGGCSVGVGGSSSFIQGDVGGGIQIRLFGE